jgi:hypothetical protein
MNATNFERHAYPDTARCLSVIYFFGSIGRFPNIAQSVETLGAKNCYPDISMLLFVEAYKTMTKSHVIQQDDEPRNVIIRGEVLI